MVDFCSTALDEGVKFQSRKETGVIYSFYLFTAALDPIGNPHGSYRLYGQEFCQFILDHQLGEVWESPARMNTAFHKDHANQVYIWMPDKDALDAWWQTYQEKQAARIEGLTIQAAECGARCATCHTTFGHTSVMGVRADGYLICIPCLGMKTYLKETTDQFTTPHIITPYRTAYGGWICSRLETKQGCKRRLVEGETVVAGFNKQGTLTGSILCAACAGITNNGQ